MSDFELAIDFIFSLMVSFWNIINSHIVFATLVLIIFLNWFLDTLRGSESARDEGHAMDRSARFSRGVSSRIRRKKP